MSEGGEGSSDVEKLRAERLDRLAATGSGDVADNDKFDEPDWFTASEEDVASAVLGPDPTEAYESQRFKSQLSADDWNAQVMANEDALSPLSMVMKRLAILEEEKDRADRRIEEEYRRRTENEDRYYLEKRRALEDAVTEIQTSAYGGGGAGA